MSSLLWCVHLLSETGQLKVKAPADMPSVAVHPSDNKMETGMEGFLSPQDDLLCIWQVPKQDISSTFSGNAKLLLESILGHDKPFSRRGNRTKTCSKTMVKYRSFKEKKSDNIICLCQGCKRSDGQTRGPDLPGYLYAKGRP